MSLLNIHRVKQSIAHTSKNIADAKAAGDEQALAKHELVLESLLESAHDVAYERACELDSPNAPGFDALRERIYEDILGIA